MEVKKKMTIYRICGEKGCCPVVDLQDDVVRIGEEGNRVELKKEEWESLVEKIKRGKIQ